MKVHILLHLKSAALLVALLLLQQTLQAQSTWAIQPAIGIASETNLGDTGLRLSTKLERQLGTRWCAFAQIGAFQMFRSNEQWKGNDAFLETRAPYTANRALGLGFSILSKSKVRLGLQAAGAYRVGRQLWPELVEIINGDPEILYTYEKISEAGYALELDLGVKVSERVWIALDAHCHNYNYFGEYLGAGLGASIRL